MTTVKRCDREAAASSAYIKGRRPAYVQDWVDGQEVSDIDGDLLAWAGELAAHREGERARVVAWLRDAYGSASAIDYIADVADEIERGAHEDQP